MDNLEDKLKKIVMTGVGAIVGAAEKTKDAIADFVTSDTAKDLADKGEKAVQSALDAGNKAFTKVKDLMTEGELKDRVEKEKARLTNLAKQVAELDAQQLDVFNDLLEEYRDTHPTDNSNPEGKDPQSEEAIGTPEVKEMDQVPAPTAKSDEPFTPTAPDRDLNTTNLQANAMNEHLNQNVPPDF